MAASPQSEMHGEIPEEAIRGPSLPSVDDLLSRCQRLLSEIERFQEHLKATGNESRVEIRSLKTPIQSEKELLLRIKEGDASTNKATHSLKSSNVPFYEAVWSITKSSKRVVAFRKHFRWKSPCQTDSTDLGKASQKHPSSKNSAFVDVVANDGAEWIKVSTTTEKRLLVEIAKQGWESDESSDDEGTGGRNMQRAFANGQDPEDEDGISVLQMAESMIRAARTHRVRYRHPKVKLVLPNLYPGRLKEIDALLSEIRAKGCGVVDGSSLDRNCSGADHVELSLESALERLTLDDHSNMSKTLNIDCTVLLALASDLSHYFEVEPQPWFNDFIRQQIDVEVHERLLERYLFPVMTDRKLVCTTAAAQRMREIVQIIGTEKEKRRTALLLGHETQSPEKTRKYLAELSDYAAPTNWQVPIEVVNSESKDPSYPVRPLPRIAKRIEQELIPINQSVFLYGWSRGLTTLTSNGSVVKQIEKLMEPDSVSRWLREDAKNPYDPSETIPEDEFVGPEVWVCSVPRSLIGKDKGRQGNQHGSQG